MTAVTLTAISTAWAMIEAPADLPFERAGMKEVTLPLPEGASLRCGDFEIGFGGDGSIVKLVRYQCTIYLLLSCGALNLKYKA